MENETNFKQTVHDNAWWNDPEFERRKQRGRIWGGLLLIGGGLLWLAKTMGLGIPGWIFTWPVFLICLGIYLIGKNGIQRPGGFIVLVIGGVFLFEHLNPGVEINNIVWPALIILAGAFMIFNPWKKSRKRKWDAWKSKLSQDKDFSGEDFLSVNSVFGGVEKNIISKNFKGGEINCVFAGAEINLSHADIAGTAILEINAVFGGMEIAVPSHWTIKSEITAVLGGVSDKRMLQGVKTDETKILILKGSAVFGGVEIKSYV